MKVYDVEQGGGEWLELRLGIPTASNFERIVTPAKLQPSAQQNKYAHELIAERVIMEPLTDMTSQWMDRGGQLEGEARLSYEFLKTTIVKQVGFVKTDDESRGCSPDGLVDDDGMIEIKVPSAKNFVAYSFGDPTNEYLMQRQIQMEICERQWCDIVIYNPDMGTIIRRVHHNADFCYRVMEECDNFLVKVGKMEEEFRNKIEKSFN